MFTDDTRAAYQQQLRQQDWRAFAEILTSAHILLAATRCGLRVVASPLAIPTLVWLAVAAALLLTTPFADLFRLLQQMLQDQPQFAQTSLGQKRRQRQRGESKHSPKPRDPSQPVSEEAFVKARQRLPFIFWLELLSLLADDFARHKAHLITFKGFRLVAMDGTTVNLPNRKALRVAFGGTTNQTNLTRVQARLVMLQFPQTRLPYRFELTAMHEGEVTAAKRLVTHLQADDLLLCDAGFWSYGLFWAVQQRHAFFAIRLRKRITLQSLQRLGPNEKLVRWTPSNRWKGLPRSMELRLLRYQVPGFRPQHIATNLLDRQRLSYDDWFRLSWQCDVEQRLLAGIAHRRWEIETSFRELKVVQGMEDSLRGRTEASIHFEIAGHVLLYFLLRCLIVQAAEQADCDPLHLSFAQALRELESIRPALLTATVDWAQVLVQRLLDRIGSHRVIVRPGRWYPRRKSSSNHRRAKQKRNSRKPKPIQQPRPQG